MRRFFPLECGGKPRIIQCKTFVVKPYWLNNLSLLVAFTTSDLCVRKNQRNNSLDTFVVANRHSQNDGGINDSCVIFERCTPSNALEISKKSVYAQLTIE